MRHTGESIITRELDRRKREEGVRRPIIVLGGMGVDISSKRLAGAVASSGEFATLSETGGAIRIARVLQDGDPDGHVRESLQSFPNQEMVAYALGKFYQESGRLEKLRKKAGKLYRPVPKYEIENRADPRVGVPLVEMLTVLDAFEQVVTARRLAGGRGFIGMNGLGKIPLPTAAALYGAMLGGADYTARGAGAKADIPAVIDTLYAGNPLDYSIAVDYVPAGSRWQHAAAHFDPAPYGGTPASKPEFWAIAGTVAGAQHYIDNGAAAIVDERRIAGGHNMPDGIPEDPYEAFLELGVPVVLAGGAARAYADVERMGGAGVQIGSLFAVTQESGMSPLERGKVVMSALLGKLRVHSNKGVSPTGYPFEVAEVDGTLSDPEVYQARTRVCDLSVLRTPYVNADGEIGWRCPADDSDKMSGRFRGPFAAKKIGEAACLCNGLFASAGMPQIDLTRGTKEPSIITLGENAGNDIRGVVAQFGRPITAQKVIDYVRLPNA
jgi:NAD(P)H-dependent flavin oxidoreductase YrpB (nitropropane dioxygenase family)